MNDKTIIFGSIVGLILGCAYLKIKNKLIKESTSEEKMHLFGICVELAKDVNRLEEKVKELEGK